MLEIKRRMKPNKKMQNKAEEDEEHENLKSFKIGNVEINQDYAMDN